MTYGCLTTKHHSGFCIWDTKTTDYSVMSSPFKRDVVKEYADAFRAEGMKVMLYYSILDTHARPASQVYNSAAYRNDQGSNFAELLNQLWCK